MEHDTICNEIRFSFSACLNGELDRVERDRLFGHLETCEECALQWAAAQESVLNLQGAFPLLEVRPGGFDRLRARIARRAALLAAEKHWETGVAAGLIATLGALCLVWLLIINDQVVEALKSLGVEMDWLLKSPLAFIAAPLLFLGLCSLMTLILSPLLLRKKRKKRAAGVSSLRHSES